MKLHNTLTKKVEDFKPIKNGLVTIYSCGPTVYDYVHIGNLSAFITADTLRRTLTTSGLKVQQVMNLTDIDDKTSSRSRKQYPNTEPLEALIELTRHYSEIFMNDMEAVGNDTVAVNFVKATDNIEKIQELVTKLYERGFAYVAEDGIYFSIEAYQKSGKKYGQLLELSAKNTSRERIANDEYDKDSVHDFALWKTQKSDEVAWDFILDGHNLLGRPGWHIECSVMSVDNLGQPFDLHTGGVDLIFPHHENEIAQSTAGKDSPMYAKYFVHNEHLLVDDKKMTKSLNNFYTLRDIVEKGFDPLAFRLMALQSHYRSQANFTWEILEAASARLKSLQSMADMSWQPIGKKSSDLGATIDQIVGAMENDLDSPKALAFLNSFSSEVLENQIASDQLEEFRELLKKIDALFGLKLSEREDITKEQKQLIAERETVRKLKHWEKADNLRKQLEEAGIGLNDTPAGVTWYRL